MNKIEKHYKIWTYILLYMSVSCFFSSCQRQDEYKPNVDFYNKPIQTMQDIILYRSDNGEVYARLTASEVNYYGGDSSRTVFPKGIKVLFYNEDLTDKAILTANYAINYTSSSNIVYLKDSIRIINFNTSDTIYCKDLFWHQDNKIVRTDLPIKRYNQNGESFGDGMIANEQFDSLTVFNPRGVETFE